MFRQARFFLTTGALLFVLTVGTTSAATFYIDGQLGSTCNGNYSVANRNCSGSAGTAWHNLDAYESNKGAISPGDTVILRPGQYWRTPQGGLVTVSGNTGNPIIYTTLPGEERQAELCTTAGKCRYNPDPACGGGGAGCPTGNRYYPTPALAVTGTNTEVHNLKTFGQACVGGSHNLIEGNDIGGGGPSFCTIAQNQGTVLAMMGAHQTVVIRNNHIHHSTRGESARNGACLMGYNFTATIEQNTFYDCYDADIRLKDQTGHSSEQSIIRNNLFLPNGLGAGDNTGFEGCVQSCEIGQHIVHNNIFFKKDQALYWDQGGGTPRLYYNNTFISSNNYDAGYWNAAANAVNAFNNLHYTTRGTGAFGLSQTSLSNVTANHNCYWEEGAGDFYWQATNTYGTFAQWQGQGKDANSTTTVDPLFVNESCIASNNCTAQDFRRSSYGENMTGSPYSARCGAYVTGGESVGADWTASGGGSVCGNNQIEGAEVCDGSALAGQTCADHGASGGTLGCLNDCSGYDVSACTSGTPLGQVQGLEFIN